MIIFQLSQQLKGLYELLGSLRQDQYVHQIEHLGNATIGAHTRHIIELLQCSIHGYHSGFVDYENRSRDLLLENNMELALATLLQLRQDINKPDKMIQIFTFPAPGETAVSPVMSSYFRELIYNTEHAIHHMALIKVALIEMKINSVDEHFGMAYSTIRYKEHMNRYGVSS
jgi:hypothetical protein